MQVLYQLSYGPVWIDGWPGAGRLDWPLGLAVSMQRAYTAAGPRSWPD